MKVSSGGAANKPARGPQTEEGVKTVAAPQASDNLGREDILRMQKEGWSFPDGGLRVANGWFVLARDPKGNWVPQCIADPDQEPDKWAVPGPKPGDQLELSWAE